MATDFTKSTSVESSLIPDILDAPLDVRTRVETEEDILSIPKPYLGMIVYVKDTGKRFEVTKLKDKKVGFTISKNALVDEYKELFVTDHLATKEELAAAAGEIDELEQSLEGQISELDEAQADIDALEAADVFKSDKATEAQLGGIKAGEQLDGLTLQEVLSKLLYPYVAPVVSLSMLSTSDEKLLEKGEAITIAKLIVDIEKKSEEIKSVSFYVDGQLVSTVTEGVAEGGTVEYAFDQAVVIEDSIKENYFTVKVEDASNNIVEQGSQAIDIVYPIYFGLVAENGSVNSNIIKGMEKVVEVKGDKIFAFTSDNEHMVIAYPIEYGSLKKIVDVNGFNLTASFKQEVVQVEMENIEDEESHEYYVYKNGASTVSNYEITIKF